MDNQRAAGMRDETPRIPHPKSVPVPYVSARAAVLIDDETNEIIWSQRAFERRDPASTTKIMTAIIAVESGRLDEWVTVSNKAAATPGSTMGVRAGDRYRLHDLLKGLLINSGNDAAVAIAEHLAGTEEAFVAQMNVRAGQMGLRNTRFRNPHGLTAANHYSSAYDLALLSLHARKYPVFRQIVCTTEEEVCGFNRHGESISRKLHNTNKLLFSYDWVDGVKTGTTSAAGQCLVTSAQVGNRRLTAVVLNSRDRWSDTLRLLEWGFEHFSVEEVARKGEVYIRVPVLGGVRRTVDLMARDDLRIIYGKDRREEIDVHVNLTPNLTAPLYKGQSVGSVTAVWNNTVLARTSLIVAEPVQASLWRRIFPFRSRTAS